MLAGVEGTRRLEWFRLGPAADQPNRYNISSIIDPALLEQISCHRVNDIGVPALLEQ